MPQNPFFPHLSRNKKSITLNLEHPHARRLFLRLCEISDILVKNFAPRAMENFGLSYDILRSANPRIILVSISFMGKKGPRRNLVCFSHTFHALSGLTRHVCDQIGKPVRIGFAYSDMITGLYAAIAGIAATIKRDTKGEEKFVDLSGYEAITSLLWAELLNSMMGSRCRSIYPRWGYYECKDEGSFCVILISNETELERLKEIIGINEHVSVITNVNVTFYSQFEMSHFSVHKSSMDGFQVVSTFYF